MEKESEREMRVCLYRDRRGFRDFQEPPGSRSMLKKPPSSKSNIIRIYATKLKQIKRINGVSFRHPARILQWAVLSRLRHDCFSATSSSSCSWNSIVPKGRESAVSVVCSVPLLALVGALSKSRCLTTMREEKNQTAVR